MRYFIRAIVIIVIIAAIVIGSQVYGYSSLQTDFEASGVSPQFNTSISSIAQSLVNVFQGNILGAVSSYIQGLNVEGSLILKNDSFVPIYLPGMEHQVEINGIMTEGVITTDGMWIAPKGSKTQEFNILVEKAELPNVVLNTLASGGNIDISVESSAAIAGFTITKKSQKKTNAIDSLSSYVSSSGSSTQSTSTVTSYGFSPNQTTIGHIVTANISMSGGTSGTYTLRLVKDIDFSPDQLITSYSITHDGTTTSKSFSFTPPNSGSYHLDLQYNGTTLWSQPNDVSRLKITSPSTPTFSVTSYGFSPNPTVLGNNVTASVTVSGGSAGTYTLRLLKDIDFGSDQLMTSYSIIHDGTTTSKSYSFALSNSGSYHLDLQYNSTTLWSQPNDVSRLKITSPSTPTFSVTSYNFSPNPIILGNSVNANISMTGGTAGTYTLGIWKDIILGTDQLITSYTITHTGSPTTKSLSFTPTNAGSYHLGLVFNGTTVWSQPNDASRLTVSIPVPIVRIINVDIPTVVTVGQTYNYNVILSNNGTMQASVTLKIDSSLTGFVSNTSIIIPASSTLNVPITTTFTPAGFRTVTYSVLYNTQVLDSLTKSIQANNPVAFSVTSYSFSPNPITLGNSVNASISMTGGTAGTYTLRLFKDIDLAPDQLITSYSIIHYGTTTSKSFSFTPSSKGSYHLDLQYNGTTLWSQPNNSSRLKVN